MVILLIAIVLFPVDLQPVQPSTNVAVVRVLSNSVTLQWDAPSEPNIATSVNCTPHSPGCAECTTSPCTIAGLTQDTEYNFTVTLSDGICNSSTYTTSSRTKGKFECGVGACVTRACWQFCMCSLSIKDILRLGPCTWGTYDCYTLYPGIVQSVIYTPHWLMKCSFIILTYVC